MTKLSKFDTVTKANEGVDIELKLLATGEGSGCFIRVCGKDSDVFRRKSVERAREAIERNQTGRSIESVQEELEVKAAETLAACTLGWRGIEGDDGNPLPFSFDAAKRLYLDYPAIRDQIDEAIASRRNFLLA